MLTYVQWKNIKEWVDWLIDKGEVAASVIVPFLTTEFGVPIWVAEGLVWLVAFCVKWGADYILDLIPHEAADGVGSHPGDMRKFRAMAAKDGDEAPTTAEIGKLAKAIPLVPLRPAKVVSPTEPLAELMPSENTTATVPLSGMVVPPFGTGYVNPNTRSVHMHDLAVGDGYIGNEYMHRTFPFVYTGSPVAGAGRIGFLNPSTLFAKGIKSVDLVPFMQPKYGMGMR